MKAYKLTVEQNKMVATIINDITKPYHAKSYTANYAMWCNEGINKVRNRAKERGIMLDDSDYSLPMVDIKAVIKEEE